MSIIGIADKSHHWDSDDVAAALNSEALTGGFYHRTSSAIERIVDGATRV